MNVFSGIRSVFEAADALKRRIMSAVEPDGSPHATLSRGLVDVTGKIVATADGATGMPLALVRPPVAVAGNLLAFDATGQVVDSGSASAGASATAAAASATTATNAANSILASPLPFHVTATLTSAGAGTAVALLADVAVPAGKKAYIAGFVAKVNGATPWATTAAVAIQDTNGTPVQFFSLAVAGLTANAEVRSGSANVTSGAAFSLGSGGTTAKGLVLKGDANGTGSDLVVTVWGFIK